MIRISALYPNTPDSRFDGDYYTGTHSPFAQDLLGPHGLRSIRTALGNAALDGAPPPFWAISELVFDDRAAFDAAMTANGEALFADVTNYTDTVPILQISELCED